jgi:tetratricopeptide (TPR) repeat protein
MAKGPVQEGLGRVERLCDAGDYQAALAELDALVASEPAYAPIHTARGWALENLGHERLPEARDAYQRALGLDPGALWAKEGLSNVLRRLGHLGEADRLCREVIEEGRARYDREEDLRELVGWCQLRLGLYDEAVLTLREALRLDGRWTAVRFDLALAMLCSGQRVRSLLEYQRGIHQAENGGLERMRGVVRVALDDLEEALAERPALASSQEAMTVRNLLRSTLATAARTG